MGRIVVTGSVAFDTIMLFDGHFGDHILADQTHKLSVSFLVGDLVTRRGGTAANIAYSLAMLGEKPMLAATVGNDFAAVSKDYDALGVDVNALITYNDITTATCYITTDLDNNQITAFHPGAMARSAAVDLQKLKDVEYVVVAPDAPDGMAKHIDDAIQMGAKLVFAPAQQLPALRDDTVRRGIDNAWLVVGNDYELELIRSRTGLDPTTMGRERIVAVTRAAHGSDIYSPGHDVAHVDAAAVNGVIDPTGAGDAYIAGLLAGLRNGHTIEESGRMGSVVAAFAIEHNGTQEHRFTLEEFDARVTAAPMATAP